MSTDVLARPGRVRSVSRRLSGAAAFDSFGTGIGATAAILFFVTMRDFSAGSVALAISVGAVFGVFSPIPCGRLADRHGLVRIYVAILILRGLLSLVYPFATSYSTFVALTICLLALEPTTVPLQQAVVGRVVDAATRVRLMARVIALRNVGLGAGTLVAGLALATDSVGLVTAVLALNGLTFFGMALAVLSIREDVQRGADGSAQESSSADDSLTAPEPGPPHAPAESTPSPAVPAVRNLPFLALCAVNGLLLLHDSVLFILLPLWVVARLDLSPVVLAALLATNTVLTVLLQTVFSRVDLGAVPRQVLLVSLGTLVTACGVGAAVENTASRPLLLVLLTLMVALLTVGENLHSVLGWQVSFALAPSEQRSEYLSAFNTGYAIQRVIGPVAMTGVVLAMYTTGWAILAATFALGWAAFWRLARRQGFAT